MKVGDILTSIFIIIVFLGLYVSNVLAIGMKKVKDNWPLYRCSPAVMPFASFFGHDVGTNFLQCIQSTQMGYMDYLMLPVNYIIGLISVIAKRIMNDINQVRGFLDKMRNKITGIIQNTFGVFLNIMIGFQKIMISMRDMVNKLVGVMATLMYVLQGALFTMESLWAGIMGQLVRSLGKK